MESTAVYPLAWTPPRNVRTFLEDMAPPSVGKRLATLRKSRGFSQETLADAIKVRARTISRWETGVTKGLYEDEVLERLADVLQVEPEDIIGQRPVPPAELYAIREQLDHLDALMEANHAMLNTLLHALGMTDKDIDEANRVSLETLRSLGRTEAPEASTTTRRAARRAHG